MSFGETIVTAMATLTSPINDSIDSEPSLKIIKPAILFLVAYLIQYLIINWDVRTKFKFLRRSILTFLIFLGFLSIFP